MIPTTGCKRKINKPWASLLLIMLLSADLAFITYHWVNILTPGFKDSLYTINTDRSYPEMYQYIKWFLIISLLAYISVKRQSFHYNVWGLLFIYFLFDDALQIHEIVGEYIAGNLNLTPPFGLRRQDIGELAVTFTAGVVILPLITLVYFHGSKIFKTMSRKMLLLLLALVFFGVVVDMADISIRSGVTVKNVLIVIEDGGEMLTASLIVWYVFLLSVRDIKAVT